MDAYRKDPIVVPIALSRTNTATITLPWFVQDTLVGNNQEGLCEYAPMPASYQPLINGEAAFGAIHDALLSARRSIDIVCWGFQPSMYLKRDGRSPCLGDLLLQKARQGVVVRILCWSSAVPFTGPISGENNLPGRNTGNSAPEAVQSFYDQCWHAGHLILEDVGLPMDEQVARLQRAYLDTAAHTLPVAPLPFSAAALPLSAAPLAPGRYARGYPNLHFTVRDFSLEDRAAIDAWVRTYGADRQLSEATRQLLSKVPTHHQKSLVVDYEDPDFAMGFVMGHNLLDAYWDTSAHRHQPTRSNLGRNVPTPLQDLSARITGRPLEYLNHNFCQGWQRATGENLLQHRTPLALFFKPDRKQGPLLMAQILRTQAQEGRRDIKTLYLFTVRNATQFIYIENQYFRWPPLAEVIKRHVQRMAAWGRQQPLYLFVVTNADHGGMGSATVNTYRMLEALGRADAIPKVAKAERVAALEKDYQHALYELQWERNSHHLGLQRSSLSSNASEQHIAQAQARAEALKAELDKARQSEVTAADIPDLKVHVCSLVALDSPPGNWRPVYVHSKLMVIDDVFLTHGSANINTRSMEVDSELNICHECADVTQPLRRELWRMHTNGLGAQDDPKIAFREWGQIIKTNKERQAIPSNQQPQAPLVGFLWLGDKRTNKD